VRSAEALSLEEQLATYAEKRYVKNAEMEGHAQGDGCNQVGVRPERQNQERLVLTQRVTSIEHLDNYAGNEI
jgi:hypothetical protein